MVKTAILAFFLFFHFSYSYADFVEPSSRVTSRLKVKEAPSTQADAAMYLYPGQRLTLLSTTSNRYYYEVQLPSNNSGWVSKAWSSIITAAPSNDLAITFFDVGQGDSTLIACPNGHNILIDAGSTSGVEADLIRDQLFDALEGRDRHIHTLVITHPDADHYNRLHLVLQGINIDQVFMVGVEDDYYQYFWNWLTGLNTDITTLNSTDVDQPGTPNPAIDCAPAQVFILAANEQSSFSASNTSSIVMMVRFNNFESILTGDATRDTEQAIINRYPATWLDIDLLKIGHHGSLATSTTANWASTLSPEIAVVSAGDNSYGHPRTEVVERLDDFTVNAVAHPMRSATRPDNEYIYTLDNTYDESIYSTHDSGVIRVISDGVAWSVTTISTEQ